MEPLVPPSGRQATHCVYPLSLEPGQGRQAEDREGGVPGVVRHREKKQGRARVVRDRQDTNETRDREGPRRNKGVRISDFQK
ncbi:hypothetical protein Pcinc_022439 [Petrolisthes cinctipes]|uniref:Uncharacterized protein n=1 Tax=Petrolisthes cinctipes TaxID=88211 RepID=A0AAE1KDP4_PETCI|nr:hypothetical protein Pcinc_022439 [Petrolisthes cinctipes]